MVDKPKPFLKGTLPRLRDPSEMSPLSSSFEVRYSPTSIRSSHNIRSSPIVDTRKEQSPDYLKNVLCINLFHHKYFNPTLTSSLFSDQARSILQDDKEGLQILDILRRQRKFKPVVKQ